MNFSDTGKKLTTRNINAFEKKINYKLQDKYIQFLLKFNGGTPQKTGFVYDVNGEEDDSVIRIFYSINNKDKLYDLFTVYQVMIEEEELEEYFLPIAEDEFGNNICIGLQDKVLGQIFFLDHEENSMNLVSSDLDNFLKLLTEV